MGLDICTNPVAEGLHNTVGQAILFTECPRQIQRIRIRKRCYVCVILPAEVNFDQKRRHLRNIILVLQLVGHQYFIHHELLLLSVTMVLALFLTVVSIDKCDFVSV